MPKHGISRRRLLQGAAGSLGALAVASPVSAGEPTRYNIGLASPAAEQAAREAATSVDRVLEWNAGDMTISGQFPEEAIDRLRDHPGVRYVEKDGELHAIAIDSDDSEVPWGVDRVDAEKAHASGETGGDGGGADIAIIDTGIDSDHPDLDVNLGAGKAFVSCTEDCNCFPFSCGNDNTCHNAWDDDHDHGTHCAGIADAVDNGEGVVGVSTAATLHAVKVLDCSGSGSYSDVAAGIKYVADRGWDVGSMSLGGDKSSTVEDAVEYADGKGVLLVAAAGNDGPCWDCVGYPAAEPEVIAVSATSKDDSLANFSSTGPEVELAAPGKDIYSTVPGGYATFSGTSMACPHVSGAGGQVMDNGLSNTEARSRLRDTAEDIGLSNNEQGDGLLDAEAAVSGGDTAPTVSWVTPSDGEEVSGTVTIQIDAGDTEDANDSLTVEYRVDGGSWRSTSYNSTSGYYEESWDTSSVNDGEHTLDARATDSGDNTSRATITASTENTDNAPSVSWVNPSDGETVGGTVSIQIDASDDRDTGDDLTVEWQANDGTWRTASYNSSSGYYEDSWDTTTVSDGDYTLDARATDTASNTSSEARITVTVDNTSSSSSPTVDTHGIIEAGSPNPHLEITVGWAVSDDDGDLSLVRVTAKDSDGNAFSESHKYSVSGSNASDTDQFKFKHAEGETADVTIYVEDEAGNSASHTEQVTE